MEIWQRAARFDRTRGTATSWIMTITHGRAVDRVRHAQAARTRDLKSVVNNFDRDADTVAESVIQPSNAAQARECLETLTALQKESITLAYFAGHTAREVSQMLSSPLPTVKTRMRDGLIRLRDCMGTAA